MLSIVTTAFNEGENLFLLCQRLQNVMQTLPYEFEVIVVDNGSQDQSRHILDSIHATDSRFQRVSLVRNFGHQGGLLAGLHHATGDAVITMDADLQHPPEVIPQLIAQWEKGYKVVHTARQEAHTHWPRLMWNRFFYWLIYALSGLRFGQADFRLLSREVYEQINQMHETEKFLRGLISWMGYPETTVDFIPDRRRHGKSKFRPGHLFDLAFHGITSFSTKPLRLLLHLGVMLFIPSFTYIIYVVTIWLFNHASTGADYAIPPGWTTLTITIILFGSLNFLSLGLIGEYIGRIYKEAKARPNFMVESSTFSAALSTHPAMTTHDSTVSDSFQKRLDQLPADNGQNGGVRL